ncbi:MAG: hypothetical protein WC856_24150 [Methylococcaceae bacterium]
MAEFPLSHGQGKRAITKSLKSKAITKPPCRFPPPHTAVRFCLLAIAKQTQGASSIALMQLKLCSNSADITHI